MQFARKGKENNMVYMSMTGCSSVAVRLWNVITEGGDISPAVMVDFGINAESDLDAYRNAILKGGVTLEQLDAALGNGPALTKLIGVPIATAWDFLPPEE